MVIVKQCAALFGAIIFLLFGAVAPAAALAVNFSPSAQTSEWMVEGSMFECRMAQPIPDFGKAVFYHEAGEDLHFFLLADSPRMKSGRAALTVTNPVWKPGGKIEPLGYVDVKEDQSSIDLNDKLANKLLQELYAGHQVEFSRQAWFDASQTVSVAISNVNFRGAYEKYVECLAELLPVNYAQVERTSLQFKAGQEELSETEINRLDDILTYAKADHAIQSFFIDGHSDSQGTRSENLEISKRRAEKVVRYLVDGGLDRSAIILRWHGERYPVASNRTANGRSENRRVTVRLSKEPPPPITDVIAPGLPPEIDTQAIQEALGQPRKKTPPSISP